MRRIKDWLVIDSPPALGLLALTACYFAPAFLFGCGGERPKSDLESCVIEQVEAVRSDNFRTREISPEMYDKIVAFCKEQHSNNTRGKG